MIRNYFFLNRLILEANELLRGATILEIFSQEKGSLVLALESGDENIFLDILVTPGSSHLTIKDKYSRAKKNTIDFFTEAVGEKIIAFEIADDDRIIRLRLKNSEIYFAIRGKYTNVFYLGLDDTFTPFKSDDKEILISTKKEFEEKRYLPGWNNLDLIPESESNYLEEARKKYPILGSKIIKEVKARAEDDESINLKTILIEVINEVKNSKPCVFIDTDAQDVNLGFENFISFSSTEKKIFENVIEAQNFLLSKEIYLNEKAYGFKLIRSHLERELVKVSNKLQNLKGAIERGSKEDEYNKYGNLLLANLNSIKARMNSISVQDAFSEGEKIEIPINPKMSPQQNVEYYFNKSKAEKTALAKSKELFSKAEKEFNHLKKTIDSLEKIESLKEVEELMKELKIKPEQEKQKSVDLSDKFKHYLVDNKYRVYVGKDSKNNDLLTTKFAKQNDYWFHARSVSGSHVVLRVENTKESIPKNILKKVASLAAYHSKAKTAGVVPVAYTFKKYVVKKKGDPTGTVRLLREDVLLVKPEIPVGCEYLSSQE